MRKMLILLLGIAAFFGGISGLQINASTEVTHQLDYQLDGGYFDLSLNQTLKFGRQANILLQGDSTGNEESEWFYGAFSELVTQYTRNSSNYYLWNDTTQNFGKPKRLSVGSDGLGYATFSGNSGTYIRVENTEATNITLGDFEATFNIAPDIWNSNYFIISKYGDAGNRSFGIYLDMGKITISYSADGTNLLSATSSDIPEVVDGESKFIKVLLDADNGASGHTWKFYTSIDGETYTQFGSDLVKSNVLSLYQSTQKIEIGTRNTGTIMPFKGNFYEILLMDGGENGTPILHLDFSNYETGTTLYDVYGNEYALFNGITLGYGSRNINILNSSVPGQVITYSKNSTRFNKQTIFPLDAVFINYSHNESTSDYTTTYTELITMHKVKYPLVKVFLVTQNAQKSPRTSEEILAHQTRNSQIKAIAIANGYGLIDGYEAVSLANIGSDGVHVTTEGNTEWKEAAITSITTNKFKVYSVSEDVIDNTKATYLGVPKKIGYTFIGFYTDAEFTTAFSPIMTNITEDVTLYAKWTPTTSGGSGSVIIDNASSFTTFDYLLMAGGVLLVIVIATSNKGKKKGKWS